MKKIIIFMLLALVSVTISAKKQKKIKIKYFTAYVYGTAVDFNDSTAYFTDVQKVDSVYYLPKTKFIGGRTEYGHQLQQYFMDKGMERHICTTFFFTSRKKAEKQYQKISLRMQKKDRMNIVTLPMSEFKFTSEKAEQEEYDAPEKQKRPKKDKGRPKGPRPDGKGPQGGPGGMPPGGGMGGPGGGMGGPGM